MRYFPVERRSTSTFPDELRFPPFLDGEYGASSAMPSRSCLEKSLPSVLCGTGRRSVGGGECPREA